MRAVTDFHTYLESSVGKTLEVYLVGGQNFTGVVKELLNDAVLISEGATGPENLITKQHIIRARIK